MMMTVGRDLAPLSPIAAFVVVVAHSLVLFLFASQGLEHALASAGLPTIPLVPVSSSQAVIGAVIGMGLIKGWRGIRLPLFGGIAIGWIATPLLAGVMCFMALYVLKNVFDQEVYRVVSYELSDPVLERLEAEGIDTSPVRDLAGKRVVSSVKFRRGLEKRTELAGSERRAYLRIAEIDPIEIDMARLSALGDGLLTGGQRAALERLAGRRFDHPWMLDEALAVASDDWKPRPDATIDRIFNRRLDEKRQAIYNLFRVRGP
jgi:PiT family inorganic phosphate transporter